MMSNFVQDTGRVEDVKRRIIAFLEASPDVEPSLPRAAWCAGPGDYYVEIGMLVRNSPSL